MKRIDNLVDNLTATIQELATELKEKSTYLRERHELLIAIRKLEPNGSDPIKDLRERLRTLKAIKELEPNGPEPIEDLRERAQATATGAGWGNATPALPEPERETFAQNAATTNGLLHEHWSEGGDPADDRDLLDQGFPKEEARIDGGTLSRGSLDAALKRPSPSTYADAFSISDRHVRDLLPLFELETSDPLFDGELSPWFADDRGCWEDDLKPLPLLRRGPGRGGPSNLARNAARTAGKRTPCAENKQEIAAKDHERYLRNEKSREAA